MRRRGLALVLGLTLPLVACIPDEDLAFRDEWIAPGAVFRWSDGTREIRRFDTLEAFRVRSPFPLALPTFVPLGIRLQSATAARLASQGAPGSDEAETWTMVLLFSTADGRIRHVVAGFPATAVAAGAREMTEEPLTDRTDGRVDALLRWWTCGSDLTMSVVDAPASYLPHARVMARSFSGACALEAPFSD